jgi:CheY-like chemotaxis protein
MGCEYQYGARGRSSLRDKVNLTIALTFLTVFIGAACYPEIDNAAAAQAAESIRRTVGVRESGARPGRTILVVENDDGQRLIAKSALERYGYNVVLADNGDQALALLRRQEQPVALVLMGGTRIKATALRQIQSTRTAVPVLLSEAPGGKHHEGATLRVERPFSAVPLAIAVGEALAKK